MPQLSYTKPHLSVAEQLQLLESRGLEVTDKVRALHCLERIGYYRLSGYLYPMRVRRFSQRESGEQHSVVLDEFRPGSSFGQVIELYVFDKRLRLLFLDAIERVEVAVRVQIALLLSSRDPWAHREKEHLHGHFARKVNPETSRTDHQDWIQRLDQTERRAKQDFAKHYRATYGGSFPIWMSIELWDFGMLSVLLSGLNAQDQEFLASKYGFQRRKQLTTSMRSINFVRNVCAHHGRLWNISPADQPTPPRRGESALLDHLVGDRVGQTRLYAVAVAIQFLLRTVNPASTWRYRLKDHLATFPNGAGLELAHSGFPSNWEQLALWQPSDAPEGGLLVEATTDAAPR